MATASALAPTARAQEISFGVSPFCTPDIVNDSIKVAREHGNGISAEDMSLCTCIKDDEFSTTQNLIRETIKGFSNPWTFRFGELVEAYEEVIRLEEVMPRLDFLYMTRVQKERFFNEEDYIRLKNFYILDKEKMELAKEKMYILHPLPRVNEISVEIDSDPRAAYFKQVQYGLYVRMALILTLLDMTDAHMNEGLLRTF